MKNNLVKKLTTLSLFLALGVVISYFESFIPYPLPVPGVRLGLANIIGLYVLYIYSPKEYLFVGLLRVLIVGALRANAINLAISAAGFVLSHLTVVGLYYLKKMSLYGLGVSSAVMHSLGQILVVMIIYQLPQMINYLPLIFFTSIASSLVISLITSILISRTKFLFEDRGEVNEE
jgi:heptaprenyl diphosphate synthase